MPVDAMDIAIIGLVAVIAAIAIGMRAWQMRYPLVLIMAGLVAGALLRTSFVWAHEPPLAAHPLSPQLIRTLFLPALLFGATMHVEGTPPRTILRSIGLLAIPGMLLTIAIVGVLIHWGIGVDWPTALLFGTIIAATDPVAVLAIFNRLGVSHNREVLVASGSLFTDGAAVVLARILLGFLLAGSVSLADGALHALALIGGGLLIGVLAGVLCVPLVILIDDRWSALALTTILAYGTFIVADALGLSGAVAVVTTGLVFSAVGVRRGVPPPLRLALRTAWDDLTFLSTSAIFLLIGLAMRLGSLLHDLELAAVAISAVMLVRAMVVYGAGHVVRPLPPVLPLRWLHVLFWSGLRGAVSLAVVLSLPVDLPVRALLLDLTFGVVLFTLLVQGLSIAPLIDRIGLAGTDLRRQAYQTRRTQLMMARAAWRELRRLEDDAVLPPRIYAQLDADYRAAGQQITAEIEALSQRDADLESHELRAIRTQLLRVERATLHDLQRQGAVDDDTVRRLAAQIDARMVAAPSADSTVVAANHP